MSELRAQRAPRGGRHLDDARHEARLDTLPNGLRVVTERMPGLGSAAVGVWVDAGARHEGAEQNGIAHFLEHMAFKGTRSRSARRIAEEIEDVRRLHQRLHQPRDDRLLRPRAGRGRAAGDGGDRRHPARSPVRGRRDRDRARGHPVGDRAGARHAGRRDLRLAAGGGLPRAAARAHDPRPGRAGERLRARGPAALRQRALRAEPDDRRGRGRGGPRRDHGAGRAPVSGT